MNQEIILIDKYQEKDYKKRGMTLLCLILLTILGLGYIYFRGGSLDALIKASEILGFSLLGTLISFPFSLVMPKGKKISYILSSLSSGFIFALFLPIGVDFKFVIISSISMSVLSFIFRLCFKNPVIHPSIFALTIMYIFNKDGLTSLLNGKSVLINIQDMPVSDLYSLKMSSFDIASKGLISDGIYSWRLFIGDYFGTIGAGIIIALVVIMAFLTFYKSLKGSIPIVYLCSLYLLFFISYYLVKAKLINCFSRSLNMVLFNEFVFSSFVLSDTEYVEKNTISTYALVVLTSAVSYLCYYYFNGYLAVLISMAFFEVLHPMFSFIKNKAVSITLLVISLCVFLLPLVIVGVY